MDIPLWTLSASRSPADPTCRLAASLPLAGGRHQPFWPRVLSRARPRLPQPGRRERATEAPLRDHGDPALSRLCVGPALSLVLPARPLDEVPSQLSHQPASSHNQAASASHTGMLSARTSSPNSGSQSEPCPPWDTKKGTGWMQIACLGPRPGRWEAGGCVMAPAGPH